MHSIKRFVAELRRRRVFRVAAMYAVVAWMLMQIGEVTFPALTLPEWTLTLVVVLLIFGFPIALILAWAFDVTDGGLVRTEASDAGDAAETMVEAEPEAVPDAVELDPAGVVVLPFQNMSPDEENEYFSDGITEDLIHRLYEAGDLRVISRTSSWQYKKETVGAKQIGADLGVGYLVEGSVRRSGNAVRIVAQLIDTSSDKHVWSATYDRELEDIFAIQTEVANSIADALHVTLTAGQHASACSVTTDVAAYELYLKGRYLWNRRSAQDLQEAVLQFQAAVDQDSLCAQAHAGLAEAYVTLAIYGLEPASEVMPLARESAAEALRCTPGQPSAVAALASVYALYDWNWDQASHAFEQAIEQNPQYSTAPQWYATNVLIPLGRYDEAIKQLELAASVDPLSPAIEASRGVVAFMQGDYSDARRRFQQLTARDERLAFAHYYDGLSALYAGDPEAALSALGHARTAGGKSAEIATARGCALAAAGREGEAREVLRSLAAGEEGLYVSPVRLAQLYAALGEPAAALTKLGEAVEQRASDLVWVNVFPGFSAVREEPGYEPIRTRVFGPSH